MARLVKNIDELIAGCRRKFQKSRNSDKAKEKFLKLLKRNDYFVVLSMDSDYVFIPFSYAAYHDCSIGERLQLRKDEDCEGSNECVIRLAKESDNPLIKKGHPGHEKLKQSYKYFCDSYDADVSKKGKAKNAKRCIFLYVENNDTSYPDESPEPEKLNDTSYPDELPKPEKLPEGAKKNVTVNAYERNPKARTKCIEFYGFNCSVCSFGFKAKYGAVGKKFIHVHHLNRGCSNNCVSLI